MKVEHKNTIEENLANHGLNFYYRILAQHYVKHANIRIDIHHYAQKLSGRNVESPYLMPSR